MAEGSDNKTPHSLGRVFLSGSNAVAVAWSMRVIGLISVLIMARLLTPEDFGMVALAMATLAVIDIFSAVGLRQALLRTRNPDRSHYDTVWTIQLALLTVLALLLVIIAPAAAALYDEPELTLVIIILSSRFIFFGLTNIGIVDFERNLEFGRDMRFRVAVRMLTFVITVSAAFYLRNYWALVIGAVLQSLFHAIGSYIVHPYRPRFSLVKRAEMLGVSGWMFLAAAAQVIHHQTERLVVGRIADMHFVGIYSVAKDLSSIFTQEIATALNRVTFVTTAQSDQSLQSDPRALSSIVGAYALIAGALGFGLAATAKDAVPVLLGEQWIMAVPFLQLVAPTAALYAVHKAVVSTLQASGHARAAAFLSLAGAGMTIGAIMLVIYSGGQPLDIAKAALIVGIVLIMADMITLGTIARTPIIPLMLAVIRPFAAALVMLVSLQVLTIDLGSSFLNLATATALGAMIFIGTVSFLWAISGRPRGAEAQISVLIKGFIKSGQRRPT